MHRDLQVGDEAPNFDLASTEGVVLMLRDEVPRTPVLLYFFGDSASERSTADLRALAAGFAERARAQVRVLAISSAKLDELTRLQRDLELDFPLLHDDRNFSSAYGVNAGEDSEPEGRLNRLVLVGRKQRVLWMADPVDRVAESLPAALAAASGVSSTANYPSSVINRLVDRWVN